MQPDTLGRAERRAGKHNGRQRMNKFLHHVTIRKGSVLIRVIDIQNTGCSQSSPSK